MDERETLEEILALLKKNWSQIKDLPGWTSSDRERVEGLIQTYWDLSKPLDIETLKTIFSDLIRDLSQFQLSSTYITKVLFEHYDHRFERFWLQGVFPLFKKSLTVEVYLTHYFAKKLKPLEESLNFLKNVSPEVPSLYRKLLLVWLSYKYDRLVIRYQKQLKKNQKLQKMLDEVRTLYKGFLSGRIWKENRFFCPPKMRGFCDELNLELMFKWLFLKYHYEHFQRIYDQQSDELASAGSKIQNLLNLIRRTKQRTSEFLDSLSDEDVFLRCDRLTKVLTDCLYTFNQVYQTETQHVAILEQRKHLFQKTLQKKEQQLSDLMIKCERSLIR